MVTPNAAKVPGSFTLSHKTKHTVKHAAVLCSSKPCARPVVAFFCLAATLGVPDPADAAWLQKGFGDPDPPLKGQIPYGEVVLIMLAREKRLERGDVDVAGRKGSSN